MSRVRIDLVRHGRAAAGWGDEPDPRLDDTGVAQAARVADLLAPAGPLAVATSPLARARETAQPLADRWGVLPRVEPRVGEIAAAGVQMADRAAWLRRVMASTWRELGPELLEWRSALLDALREADRDTVVFTHFIAINAAVGAALGDDRVVCFRPANGSVTAVELHEGAFRVVSLGDEAETQVR